MTDQDDGFWEGELRADGEHVADGRIEWLTGAALAARFHTEPLSDEQRRRINEGPLELHYVDPQGRSGWIPDDAMTADGLVTETPSEVFLTSKDSQRWLTQP